MLGVPCILNYLQALPQDPEVYRKFPLTLLNNTSSVEGPNSTQKSSNRIVMHNLGIELFGIFLGLASGGRFFVHLYSKTLTVGGRASITVNICIFSATIIPISSDFSIF